MMKNWKYFCFGLLVFELFMTLMAQFIQVIFS